MFCFYYQYESVENLAGHTFVLVNARFCLPIQKRFFVYDNVQILKNFKIRLDALVAKRDMDVRARSAATRSASCWEKNIF